MFKKRNFRDFLADRLIHSGSFVSTTSKLPPRL